MTRSAIAIAALMTGSLICWSGSAAAQPGAATPERFAQVPAPAPSVAPPPAAPAANQTAAPAPAAAAAADPIGSVATLQGGASVTHDGAAARSKLRDSIYQGDVLQTGLDGTLGVTFDDDTTFTLSPNSRITVDNFVYREGGAGNAAVFNIVHGTVAFVASEVARTGDIENSDADRKPGDSRHHRADRSAGRRHARAGTGQVAIKLYADANGAVGRIEVIDRDGRQLGILTRGATGFAIRPGAPGAPLRFTAVPLQISPQEAARDQSFVRQAFSAQRLGRQFNIQRRALERRNLQRRPGRPPGRGRLPQFQQRRGQPAPNFQRQPGPRLPDRSAAGRSAAIRIRIDRARPQSQSTPSMACACRTARRRPKLRG